MSKRPLNYLLCCCLLLLAGCSTTRLAYDHLDTLLRWQASHYVDMNRQQKQMFDTELRRLWNWHRGTQLPLYAAALRQLAGTVRSGPVGLEQLEAVDTQLNGYWNNVVERALPGFARLHALLSDAQVADMVQRIGKEMERRAHKTDKLTDAERRQRMDERMEDLLSDWIGRPNAQQRELVWQWAAQAPLITPQPQARQAELEHYADLLATRTQAGFEQRMRVFIEAPRGADDPQSQEAQQQRRWLQLLADLSATLEPAQRQHLSGRLLDYAADFDSLAAEKPGPEADSASP